MGSRRIVCVEPAGGSGQLVVVEVQQNGAQPLDVRLVGCEGENPYVATIKHRDLGKLKHKFKGSNDEWATVLAHFLLQQQPGKNLAHLLDGVRLVYTLRKNELDISLRQDVQGIKVTLGEIVLPRDDDFEFNPFEWAQASAQAHSQTLQELATLKLRVSGEQDTIDKLNAQLQDFIKAKDESETAMLQQFMELLNEKKRKIRDQSRLLAVAKVDASTAVAVQASRKDAKPRKAGASRTSKRKAPSPKTEPVSEPEADCDQMEIDQAKQEEQDDDEEPAATPEPSDDETDGEDEVTAASAGTSQTAKPVSVATSANADTPETEGRPPPKRELPFGRPATRNAAPPKKAPSPADDETDDEEL